MKARDFLLNESITGLAVFFLIVIPLAGQAETKTALVVDGRYEDWNLGKESARPVSTKSAAQCTCNVLYSGRKCLGEKMPNVYLRYDSISNTLFVLVLQKETMQDGTWKPMVNIYPLGRNSPISTKGSEKKTDFSWVTEKGQRVGWEGAFQLTAGSYDCETGKIVGKAETGKSESRKTASEVEVIDMEKLFFKCK